MSDDIEQVSSVLAADTGRPTYPQLRSGEALEIGDTLTSPSGIFRLVFERDSDGLALALYDARRAGTIWRLPAEDSGSATEGWRLDLYPNRDLVFYAPDAAAEGSAGR